MAIVLEFIDFIIPIEVIRNKYPGGWDQCLKDYRNVIGGRVWYDDHLFRDGAMSPNDIRILISEWEKLGFDGIAEHDGKQYWKDVCVVEAMFGGATLPCEWIEIDLEKRIAWQKDSEPGIVIDRDNINLK
jgi:hypothetical protein